MSTTKLRGWELYRSLGSPRYVVPPMVDMSELPFRLLTRRYGAELTYTPMIHSRLYATEEYYREMFTFSDDDHPVFAQLCANDPEHLLDAARLVSPHVDAVDINFGCPQMIAKRGRYGAYLMDDLDTVRALISTLHRELDIPVTCKIRVFPDVQDTIRYAKMIEDAGCQILAVHGRTRDQRKSRLSRADWAQIKAVVDNVSIPVFGNGNIATFEDINRCMEATGVVGMMSAESLLDNPALFSGRRLVPATTMTAEAMAHIGTGILSTDLATEYLDLVEQYPAKYNSIRAHLFRILGPDVHRVTEMRDILHGAKTMPVFREVVAGVQRAHEQALRGELVATLEAAAQQRQTNCAAEESQSYTEDELDQLPALFD